MDNLTPTSPCAGLLPLTVGRMTVSEMDCGPITSVTPFDGGSQPALAQALGLPFPAPLRTTADGDLRCVWVGQGEALLMGGAPAAGLAALAAVVDQSDAWAVVHLHGPQGAEVMARLSPVDLRLHAFGTLATVRTQLGHMNASITRLDDDSLMIAVFRSMAGTLVHDLARALEAVAARG